MGLATHRSHNVVTGGRYRHEGSTTATVPSTLTSKLNCTFTNFKFKFKFKPTLGAATQAYDVPVSDGGDSHGGPVVCRCIL